MRKDVQLLTVTWSGDKENFSILRESLDKSSLSDVRHDVVVQSEDMHFFQDTYGSGFNLLPSSDVLPKGVDQRRQRARARQERYGRRFARLSTSLARHSKLFDWSRYLGWQTQQLSKLAYVANSDCDLVVVLDSDVVVTRHADVSFFLNTTGTPCLEQFVARGSLSGKTKKWVETAESLLGAPSVGHNQIGSYFDTPFVMSPRLVRSMMKSLQKRYNKPWWQVLLNLPPRRWSEFALYKNFLRVAVAPEKIEWVEPVNVGVIFDLSDKMSVLEAFNNLQELQSCHYITLHSQASGRHDWSADQYRDEILESL